MPTKYLGSTGVGLIILSGAKGTIIPSDSPRPFVWMDGGRLFSDCGSIIIGSEAPIELGGGWGH